jgi:hypothetical protein
MKLKIFLAAVVAAFTIQQTPAVPIVGQVDMSGVATLDNTDLALATSASFPGSPDGFVIQGSGSYAGTEGAVVTWTDFSWNPPSTPVTPLWTYMFGGDTYSFDLATLTVVSQSSSFLNLTGTGTATISGGLYDPTPGTWSFTISDTGGPNANMRFVYVSNTAAEGVPEGGSAIALLGFALLALEGVRRWICIADWPSCRKPARF